MWRLSQWDRAVDKSPEGEHVHVSKGVGAGVGGRRVDAISVSHSPVARLMVWVTRVGATMGTGIFKAYAGNIRTYLWTEG